MGAAVCTFHPRVNAQLLTFSLCLAAHTCVNNCSLWWKLIKHNTALVHLMSNITQSWGFLLLSQSPNIGKLVHKMRAAADWPILFLQFLLFQTIGFFLLGNFCCCLSLFNRPWNSCRARFTRNKCNRFDLFSAFVKAVISKNHRVANWVHDHFFLKLAHRVFGFKTPAVHFYLKQIPKDAKCTCTME